MKNVSPKEPKAIEPAPIRLTADETRLLIAASMATKPIENYHGDSLANLGLVKRVPLRDPKEKAVKLKTAWIELAAAARARQFSIVKTKLDEIANITHYERPGYIITPLGREVVRGITIRLTKEYAGPKQ